MEQGAMKIACLGGGHGLYQTLRAARQMTPDGITAIVTVADDGGSSGRLRRELQMIPPGDLRMALAALARDENDAQLWAKTLQHRFGGNGALAGHAVGNLLIAGLAGVLGDEQQALDAVADLTRSHGRVLPVVMQQLEIEADVAGLDDDPRLLRPVRGQVAVASTPGEVRRVRILPEEPAANPNALQAIAEADMITLGPGSWFSSVLPHVMVPEIVEAISAASAQRVVILNLSAEPGETSGFSAERHLHVLAQHAPDLRVDKVLVEEGTVPVRANREHLQRAADSFGAEVVYEQVSALSDEGRIIARHEPDKLARALMAMHAR